MNLLKKISFYFRKNRTENSDPPKPSKTKWRTSKAQKIHKKPKKAKQKSKIFVPPAIENSLRSSPSGAQPQKKVPQRGSSSTSKNSRKVRIPSQVKLVITGSVGAGKTTAIGSISDKNPITTEARPSDEIALVKATTTTSMDYGTFSHSLKSKIHLYGTPGQKRFSFMGAILTEGASGLIILINNNQKEPFQDLDFYLKHNEEFLKTNHAVIGITHFDVNNKHSISDYGNYIGKMGMQWPIVPIDARKGTDVLKLIDMVIDATFGETTFRPTALKA